MHRRRWVQLLSGALFPSIPVNFANFPKYLTSSFILCVWAERYLK
jgi:hypothetical protein